MKNSFLSWSAVAICITLPYVVHAQVTYTYTGLDYTKFEPAYVGLPVTGSDSITGSFTVSSALTYSGGAFGYYALYGSTPGFSYDFTDGVNSYTNTNQGTGGFGTDFEINVNQAGAIIYWQIDLTISPVVDGSLDYANASIQTAWQANDTPGTFTDAVNYTEYSSYIDGAFAPGPGSWSGPIATVSTVPDNSTTLGLLGGALAGLALLRRRFAR